MKNKFITAALAAVLSLSAAPLALAAPAVEQGSVDGSGNYTPGFGKDTKGESFVVNKDRPTYEKWIKTPGKPAVTSLNKDGKDFALKGDGEARATATWTNDKGEEQTGYLKIDKDGKLIMNGNNPQIFDENGEAVTPTFAPGKQAKLDAVGETTTPAVPPVFKDTAEMADDNAKGVERNKSDISDLRKDTSDAFDVTQRVLEKHGSDIANVNQKVETNTSNISHNANAISANSETIAQNKEAQDAWNAETGNTLQKHGDTLADHDKRISANGNAITDNAKNIGANTKAIGENKGRIDEAEGRIGVNETHLKAHDEQIARNKSDIGANKILAKQQADDAENHAKGYTDNRLGDLGYTPKRDANGNIMLDANGKAIPAQPKTASASPFMRLAQTDNGNNGGIPETAGGGNGGGTPPADGPKATVKDYVDVQRAEAMREVNQNIAAASQNTLNTANAYADGVGARALQSANAYTDSRYNQLNGKLKKLRSRADAGTAAAVAIGSLAFDTLNPNAMAGGLSVAKNKVAGAVGYQRNFNKNWRARGTISVSDSYVTGGASVGYSW